MSASGWPGRRRSRDARQPTGEPGLRVKLRHDELELIDRLVRDDRTAVSSALLAIAGIGAGEAIRGAVLAQLRQTACWAQATA